MEMSKTKIDWCDSTWNPVTGCMYGCEYCYARRIAQRFGGTDSEVFDRQYRKFAKHELDRPLRLNGRKAPYPYGFAPTLHRYRLNDYIDKKGRNIFVCSMADLFGEWVSDDWIEEVFRACEEAPQHNYLFLTKNPLRYAKLAEKGILRYKKNMWYGWTEIKDAQHKLFSLPKGTNTFVSVEPLWEPVRPSLQDWIIVGAETGRRKGRVIPKREWIEQIVEDCREWDIPLFMKASLADIWGEPLIQEFPEQLTAATKERRGRQ